MPKTFRASLFSGVILFGALLVGATAGANDGPTSFTYQGRVFKANGAEPLEAPSVTFKIQIRSPDGLCLLFEESHLRDMRGTSGIFSLIVGEGTNTNQSMLSLVETFDNRMAKTGASGCAYMPADGDTRRLRFSYHDGTETVSMPMDQTMRSVPYAMNSATLGGLGKAQFLQVSSQATQVKIDALAAGTSNLYVKASDLPVAGGILNLSSGGVMVSDTPSTGAAAVNKNYTDAFIGGRSIDLSSIGNGKTIVWNSATSKWEAAALNANLSSGDVVTALGFTPLNKSGDTLSGALDMATHNITNAGFITMGAGKYLSLGNFSAAAETNLITGTLTPGGVTYVGVTWFNSSTKVMKYWDGTQAVTLTAGGGGGSLALNGQSGAAQAFAVASAGTTLGFSSAADLHTLNIPLAATAGAGAGLLSNADYASFAAKLSTVSGASLAAGMVWAGNGSGQAAARYLSIADVRSSAGAGTSNFFNVSGACAAGQAITYSSVNDRLECAASSITSAQVVTALGFTPVSAAVTSVSAAAPLSVSNGTTTASISISKADAATNGYLSSSDWSTFNAKVSTTDVGTSANKIVALDANAKLPAVDGSQLTNLPQTGFTNMQVFTTNSSWTPPAGVTKAYVQVWGAGGGGGGGNPGLVSGGGSGGAGGGFASGIYTITANTAITITVGTGGSAGVANGNGAAGTGSSFGGYASAGGGAGGLKGSVVPTIGGIASGLIAILGGKGGPGVGSTGGMGGAGAGGGGVGSWGGSGSAVAGSEGLAPAGGGAGGYGDLGSSSAGGAGAVGRVVIWY